MMGEKDLKYTAYVPEYEVYCCHGCVARLRSQGPGDRSRYRLFLEARANCWIEADELREILEFMDYLNSGKSKLPAKPLTGWVY